MQKNQFLRLERLIGKDNVESLHEKKIALFGVGAVGGYALETAARSGIGHIRAIDFDSFSESNLNRQILALHSTVGRKKVEVARERVLDINPDCDFQGFDEFADESNYERLIGDADIVLDCIDSLGPKCSLIEHCLKTGIPIMSSMGAALRTNPFLVRKGTLNETWGCPLSKKVRSEIKKRGCDTSLLPVIFSPEQVSFNYTRPEDEESGDGKSTRGRDRVVLGSMMSVTAIFGIMLMHEALSMLLGTGVLDGKEAWKPTERQRGRKG